MMKRISVLLFLAAFLFSACGKSNSSNDGNSKNEDPGKSDSKVLMTATIIIPDEDNQTINYKGIITSSWKSLYPKNCVADLSGTPDKKILRISTEMKNSAGEISNVNFLLSPNNENQAVAEGDYLSSDTQFNLLPSFVKDDKSNEEVYSLDIQNGKLSITQMTNDYIKGTFSFEASNIRNKKVIVKEGAFEGVLYIP